MKVNNITFSPNFRAQFSNDKQTKNNLGALINGPEDVDRVCQVVNDLEFVGNDSKISLTRSGYNIVATSSSTGNSVHLGNTHSEKPLFNLAKIVSNPYNPHYKELFGDEFEFNLLADSDTFAKKVSKLAKKDKYEREKLHIEKQIANLENEQYVLNNKIQKLCYERDEVEKEYTNARRNAILSLIG